MGDPQAKSMCRVRFVLTNFGLKGYEPYILGNIGQLGNWEIADSVHLSTDPDTGATFTAVFEVASLASFEYRYLGRAVESSGASESDIVYEEGEKRKLSLPALFPTAPVEGIVIIADEWNTGGNSRKPTSVSLLKPLASTSSDIFTKTGELRPPTPTGSPLHHKPQFTCPDCEAKETVMQSLYEDMKTRSESDLVNVKEMKMAIGAGVSKLRSMQQNRDDDNAENPDSAAGGGDSDDVEALKKKLVDSEYRQTELHSEIDELVVEVTKASTERDQQRFIVSLLLNDDQDRLASKDLDGTIAKAEKFVIEAEKRQNKLRTAENVTEILRTDLQKEQEQREQLQKQVDALQDKLAEARKQKGVSWQEADKLRKHAAALHGELEPLQQLIQALVAEIGKITEQEGDNG